MVNIDNKGKIMALKKSYIFIILIALIFYPLQAFFPINFFRPWDINLRPPKWCGAPLQLTGYYEGGVRSNGYNAQNHTVNVLQIWNDNQDALGNA